jgi:hypothetical protein
MGILVVAVVLCSLSIIAYANTGEYNTTYSTLYSPRVQISGVEYMDFYGVSMCPTLVEGYTLQCSKMPFSRLEVGHIIFYKEDPTKDCRNWEEDHNCIVHRVINITEHGVITKGDNPYTNPYDDGLITRDQYYCTVFAVEYTGDYEGDCINYNYSGWYE